MIIMMIRLSRRKNQLEKFFTAKEKDYEEKNYQMTMLEGIQREIDYSLKTFKIIEILSRSFQDFIPFATITTLVIESDKLFFHSTLQDKVSKNFLEKVKESMITSAKNIVPYSIPVVQDHTIEGELLDYTNGTEDLGSFFHIPVIISGSLAGIITLASPIPQYYSFSNMIMLYKTMEHASDMITSLRAVIDTEKRRLSSLITSLHDGILMIDDNGIVQVINNAAKDILNIHKESPEMFDVMQALSKTYPIDQKIYSAKQSNQTIHDKEVSVGEKTLQIDITPVVAAIPDNRKNKAGIRVIGISIVLHDITLEKSLMQLKEDFTNEIVHELRSPLSAIKASAQMMASDSNLPPENAKFIEIIVQQSERMLGDIASLLDVAKLENGKFSIMQKSSDVKKLIEDSITLFNTAAQEKKIKLIQNIETNLSPGLLDSNRISQVINNLISNSMKYTPEGGSITISANYHYNEHLPATVTNPGILISVSDTGLGIPRDKQSILFSKFGQVQNSKFKPKEGGTGLGLYVSKGIVEAHGGSIYLESEEGKGTKISFTIPLAREKITAKITSARELLKS